MFTYFLYNYKKIVCLGSSRYLYGLWKLTQQHVQNYHYHTIALIPTKIEEFNPKNLQTYNK